MNTCDGSGRKGGFKKRSMAPRRKFDLNFKERVLQYAEETSGQEAARHFNVDTRRIQYWRKQKEELLQAEQAEPGGPGETVSEELEERLSDWIYCHQHSLSRKTIKQRALDICPSVSDGDKAFTASADWLQSFLRRHDLLLRRRAATPQVDPGVLTDKLVAFIDHVGRTASSKDISGQDIIAMDETAVCFDDTAAADDSKGHKRRQLTVALAAAADGTKLKPFIVFRGADGEVAELQQQVSGAVVASSVNGWMSDALTARWLQTVVGKSGATPRLLVWDSYRCHVSAATKAELKSGYDITTAAIPGGCTKYVQAPVVMWNEPFQRNLHAAYEAWRAGDATPGGNPKLPERRLLVDWVVAAWDKLDPDMIAESFKACGLSVKRDGSEDHLIVCFKEGQPCGGGREALTLVRQQNHENQEEEEEEEDEEELFNNELVVLDDEEEEQEEVSVKPVMSVIHTRGEVGGGVAAHLQCPFCGHFSKSHAHQLTHMAASHPTSLDSVPVGRLGNILMYQSTARLFHCSDCFFTCRDFTKLYKHIISKHCVDEREAGGDEEGGKDKGRSDAEEEEEEGEGADDGAASQKEESAKADCEGDDSIVMFDTAGYHCLICGWKTKLKSLVVGHVVRKHDIPKAYATQAVRRDTATMASSTEEEEVTSGLSGELLKEEMEATAKVVRFISNRFMCLICGWKTKLKGFAISHVVRSHDVERPYACRACPRSFFLPSRLQQHVQAAHRPGRFACPFCCFRSHFLGGFRRHCSRCNAREEEEGGEQEGGGAGVWLEQEENEEQEVQEERKERRGARKRRRTEKLLEEEEED